MFGLTYVYARVAAAFFVRTYFCLPHNSSLHLFYYTSHNLKIVLHCAMVSSGETTVWPIVRSSV